MRLILAVTSQRLLVAVPAPGADTLNTQTSFEIAFARAPGR